MDRQGYKVVTLTASCGLMLKFEWPLLLPNNENIKKLSGNVMDIDEYVVDIANNEGLVEGLNEIDGGITLYISCLSCEHRTWVSKQEIC